VQKILVQKPKGKVHSGDLYVGGKDNINMYLREIRCGME
jgi:hypothetical protein